MWSFLLSVCGLLSQAIFPCKVPELLPANTLNTQQYVGKWYFKAATSFKEDHIQMFKAMDNAVYTIEETAKGTLLLSGSMRIKDSCVNRTWTYHIHPEREDMELEGRPQRRTLLWSGKSANCPDCIILQEIEPPLSDAEAEDSLARSMLYARHSDGDAMVKAFRANSACNGGPAFVAMPQTKEFCT
ncbi:apolipoprotein M-like [Genypterus blacodes]|uniref:apolipoprotein M-like n=1 Tax=Genypterus blacodes TaxID=154954 RepID=UPI003F76E077